MDAVAALRSYVESVLTSVQDMKVLLFDSETAHMASLVYTQSELLKHDVVLIEPLQARVSKPVDDAMTILQCVCVLRCTPQNIRDLCSELNCPHFNAYYIFFTGVVPRDCLQQIAFADHSSKVFGVHEVFIDVLALNKRLFSLGMHSSIRAIERNNGDPKMQRIIDGLFSVLCALKLRAGIKYEATSALCKVIGDRLAQQIQGNSDLFQGTGTSAVVLLVDRRTDPLTPLLHSWSYQGLIHEMIGIHNNVVTQRTGKQQAVVVDERTDDFFAHNLYTNYGELGDAVKALTEGVKAQHTDVKDITDIDTLKKFIHTYPVYQEKQALAAKHAGVLGEISEIVAREKLISFAPLEQRIAAQSDQTGHRSAVMEAIQNPETTDQNALRVALLYALHYENSDGADIDGVKRALSERPRGEKLAETVDVMLEFAGRRFDRSQPLFAAQGLFSRARGLIGGLDENKFGLYAPGLTGLIQKLERKQLDAAGFKSAREVPGSAEPKKYIIFFVGGATYEEGHIAYTAAANGLDVIVGGTTIHNTNSFIQGEVLGD